MVLCCPHVISFLGREWLTAAAGTAAVASKFDFTIDLKNEHVSQLPLYKISPFHIEIGDLHVFKKHFHESFKQSLIQAVVDDLRQSQESVENLPAGLEKYESAIQQAQAKKAALEKEIQTAKTARQRTDITAKQTTIHQLTMTIQNYQEIIRQTILEVEKTKIERAEAKLHASLDDLLTNVSYLSEGAKEEFRDELLEAVIKNLNLSDNDRSSIKHYFGNHDSQIHKVDDAHTFAKILDLKKRVDAKFMSQCDKLPHR